MKKLSILLLLIMSVNVYSQLDTEFWFVAPDVTYRHGTSTNTFQITTTALSNIVISQPANPSFIPIIYNNVPANTVKIVDLRALGRYKPVNMIEDSVPDNVNNVGFLIQSNQPINVYYEKGGTLNAAIFNLKGKSSLGTNFVIPKQSNWNYSPHPENPPYPKRGFDIVASEDNTTVTIIPSQDIVGHAAGVPFNKSLNKGQTYAAIRNATPTLTKNYNVVIGFLEGSIITSTKDIAITLFDDSQYYSGASSGFDLTGDQIFPVSKTGKEYIAIKGEMALRDDYVFITAIQNNTDVLVDGVLMATINAGQSYDFVFSSIVNDYVHITTSNDAYAYQVTGNGGELTASILPPTDQCAGSRITGFTRSDLGTSGGALKFQTNIIVQSLPGAESNFKLFINGVESPGAIDPLAFQSVGTDWKMARITSLSALINTNDACVLTNDLAFFQLGIFNSNASVAEYGYFSDVNPIGLEAYISGVYDTNVVKICAGYPLQLVTISGGKPKGFQWSPDIYFVEAKGDTLANPYVNFSISDSIKYMVTATLCNKLDTAFITVIADALGPQPKSQSLTACSNQLIPDFQFKNLPTGSVMEWYSDSLRTSLPDTSSAPPLYGYEVKRNISAGEHIYWVDVATSTVCKSNPVKLFLKVVQPSDQNPGTANPATICSDEPFDLMNTLSGASLGGYIIDTSGRVPKNSTTFSPVGAGGVYGFAYTFNYLGCPVDTAWITVTSDKEKPTITCTPIIIRKSALNSSYTLLTDGSDKEFDKITVGDNCKYKLYNNVNNDTALIGGIINGSRTIRWTVIDSARNVQTCETIFKILILEIPNTITPNGDDFNDFFDLDLSQEYPKAILEIYDRWGKLIFTSKPGYPDDNKWKGTYDGKRVPVDTYHYIVRDDANVVHKGFISVVY